MGNFLDVARDLLASGEVRDRAEHFTRVFETIGQLQRVHSKANLDLDNLEAIFTILELGKVIGSVPGKSSVDEIDEAIASLRQLIVGTLEATMRFPFEGRYLAAPEPYPEFARLVYDVSQEWEPRKTVSVITFNYDVAADQALYRAGLGPDYVLAKPTSSRVNPAIRLMKLHGSLNWATAHTDSGATEIRPLQLAEYFSRWNHDPFLDPTAQVVEIGTHLKETLLRLDKSLELGDEPLIVPPSWNKADYHRALSSVWKRAAADLSEAERIYVIGYSLPETDSFFRHLYALGSVGQFPLRRFGVYNPDGSGATETRFRSLLGPAAAQRFQYVPLTFKEAIQHIRADFDA